MRGAGSEGSAGGDSPLAGVIPPARDAYGAINANTALTLPSVYRAVSLLSSSVSQLPLGVWRYGAEIPVSSSNNNGILRKPDLSMSVNRFLERTTVSLATNGNAYWRLYRNSASEPVTNVEVLNPLNVYVERKQDGALTYWYQGKELRDWQVTQLRLLDVPGCDYGLGPIQAAQTSLRGAIDLSRYSDNWFGQSQVPSGILSVNTQLDPDIAAQYQQAFIQSQAAGRGVVVLGSETKYQPVYLNPADAQFLESQRFTAQQIARLFGIPAHKLGVGVDGSAFTYQNTEQANTDFVRDTLVQYLTEIETALSDLLPRGQEVRFKLDGLLRSDQATRFEGYAVAITNGFMTKNEVREREGLPPLPPSESEAA